jgi:hypothetical protein
MKDAIKLSLQDAVDLLRKWMDENRIIQVSIVADDNFTYKVHGRLDEYSHAEHAPEPLRSQLPKGYDALLYVYRRGVRLGLAALSPAEEWL